MANPNTIGDSLNQQLNQDINTLIDPVKNLNETCLPKNSNNDRTGNTAKKNYSNIVYGNKDGTIGFGQIHKNGDVTSDVLLQASDGRHSICLDKDGPRKGWTTITCPGNFQILCAVDEGRTKEQDAMMICAKRGNINVVAVDGKLRFEADDIEFVARGEKTNEGNIRMNASESISLDAKKILINGKSYTKIASSGNVEVAANGCLKQYGSIIQGVSDAVSLKDSKVGGKEFQINQLLGG